jgi:DNA-binding transcriptional LysR family regulator
MDVHQLELLLAVMDSPSLTKAAEKMRLSPAAVSLQLHALAKELKTELFVRAGRRLQPTPAGRRLAEKARAVVAQMEQIRQEFASEPREDTRPFHFATGATTLIYRLARPFRRLRELFPRLDLHVSVLATEEMIAGLFDRQFDLALISLPAGDESLRITPLFEEELLLLRPSSTRVRGHHIGTVQPQELDGAPFLLYPNQSNMRVLIDHFLDGFEVRRRVVMEAADTEAIKRLVEAGFGYSMLPESALREPMPFFHLMRVGGQRLVRRQALARPAAAPVRPLTEAVASFLQQSFRATPRSQERIAG